MNKVKAEIVYYDPIQDIVEIKVGSHHIRYGGPGDGYCYKHQSFDCKLTEEEQRAVHSV